MSSGDDDRAPRRRLRVPAALAVAFLGSSAAVTMWYGGCAPDTTDPLPDAGERFESKFDAGIDADEAPDDAVIDAATADAPPDSSPPPH